MDAFEKHLSQIKYSSPPDKLRERCLAGLKSDMKQDSSGAKSMENIAKDFWNRWLWPAPKAWAGLACIWVICFGLNHWTLPLVQLTPGSYPAQSSRQNMPPISVMHYSWVLDSEIEPWSPEVSNPAAESQDEGIQPNASRRRVHPKNRRFHARGAVTHPFTQTATIHS